MEEKKKNESIMQPIESVSSTSDGAKSITLPMGADYLPTSTGTFSSPFNKARTRQDGSTYYHKGIDIALPVNSDIFATNSGVVQKIGNDPKGYGKYMILSHGNGLTTLYAHLNNNQMYQVGDNVTAGQVIAKSGNTGRSTGPHLHYEVRQDGVKVDPVPFFKSAHLAQR